MRKTGLVAAVVLFVASSLPVAGQGKGDKFLKDGKLTQPLMVRDLQSGFAGVGGREWKVELSGEWQMANVFQGKAKKVEQQGKLSPDELKALAAALAKYDVETLESKKKSVGANPKSLVVRWGDKENVVIMNAGAEMPKEDPATLEGRYAGIILAVRKLAVPPNK
jgi:hypothetical protein